LKLNNLGRKSSLNIEDELTILDQLIKYAEERNDSMYASYLRGRRDALKGILADKDNGEKKQ
jgi:hypothetical protein